MTKIERFTWWMNKKLRTTISLKREIWYFLEKSKDVNSIWMNSKDILRNLSFHFPIPLSEYLSNNKIKLYMTNGVTEGYCRITFNSYNKQSVLINSTGKIIRHYGTKEERKITKKLNGI